MRLLGSPPRSIFPRDEAIRIAAEVDIPALGKYLSTITGSYVSPAIRERLEEIAGVQVIPSAESRSGADTLLDRRRALLAKLAEIDRQISALLGPEGVDLVARATTIH